MTRYHINFEGKIYPCKAKVYKCPYGEDFHADSQVELYYKLMREHGSDAQPSELAKEEIQRTNRLRSLYTMSQAIAQVDYPVDVIVSSLQEGLSKIEHPNVREDVVKYKLFEDAVIEDVRLAYLNELTHLPPFVPQELIKRGKEKFLTVDKGIPIDDASPADIERRQNAVFQKLLKRKGAYKDYLYHMENQVNHRNYESSYVWMSRDFEKFSHDLNTSKMITQPMFYGSIERAKQTIKQMDNYELLAAYDDYSVTDKEIERSVQKANYFKYEWRKDLTDEANKSLQKWYDRNKEIYDKWKIDTPKRILLSMELANELDRRGVLRQDLAVDEMLAEIKK